ncbi:MAG: hypothetical protein QGG71_12530 [Pirellulaceae bacterium]|nr:hypothetical protein [Pirellulaceae bacterium]
MFGKRMRMGVILAAALGGPFLWYNRPAAENLQANVKSWLSRGGSSVFGWPSNQSGALLEVPLTSQTQAASVTGSGNSPVSVLPTLTGPASSDLRTLFRFDVSPRWVTERWSRVSTVRGEPDWEGLRVPVVTGTQFDDLAGSLTYYFDAKHQVRRITFHGVTGDERKLVTFVSQVYDMKPDSDLAGSLHIARWNGQPTSVLRVALAPVIRSNMPHSRLEILLELNRPSVGFRLSSQSDSILQQHRENRGW